MKYLYILWKFLYLFFCKVICNRKHTLKEINFSIPESITITCIRNFIIEYHYKISFVFFCLGCQLPWFQTSHLSAISFDHILLFLFVAVLVFLVIYALYFNKRMFAQLMIKYRSCSFLVLVYLQKYIFIMVCPTYFWTTSSKIKRLRQ